MQLPHSSSKPAPHKLPNMGIEVGSKVRCKSRIFGETWAKEKYGVGPGGWTTQWEKGVVIEAVSRHFWKVKFSDDAEMEISSQNLRLLSADTVLDCGRKGCLSTGDMVLLLLFSSCSVKFL